MLLLLLLLFWFWFGFGFGFKHLAVADIVTTSYITKHFAPISPLTAV